jgi:signal transduction histidine kinase
MPHGGVVTVQAEECLRADGQVAARAERQCRRARACVDRRPGIGIPKEHLSRIFDP